MTKARKAFTLIEVMISVLIISTVIMALITMSGNNTHIFSSFKKQVQVNQYVSFFISKKDYGFENDSVDLDDLVSEFDVEDELRKKLKELKVEVLYQIVDEIDMSDFEESEEDEDTQEELPDETSDEEDKQVSSNLVIEIGRTTLKVKDSSASLLRIKVQ